MGSPCDFFPKNGSKSSVIPWIEKSWPFGPKKIVFKMSYGCFPLGGASNAPPLLIGLTPIYTDSTSSGSMSPTTCPGGKPGGVKEAMETLGADAVF